MKLLKPLMFAGAAVGLVAAPIAAQSTARIAAPITAEDELGGDIGPAAIIVALAAVGMVILLVTDDDDDEAVSP